MTDLVQKRLLFSWFLLCAITLVYVAMDVSAGDQRPGASALVTAIAILIALIKVRLIMRELMDVRHAPGLLRHVTDGLVVVMAIALIGSYAAGRASG